MFYNLSQRLQNSCFSFSFQLQPEFYGADAVDKPAYSRSRARKLGRYVRIFPYRHIPDTPFICMQVEIFGEPYISKCFLMNRLVSSCPKTNNQTQTKKKKEIRKHRGWEPSNYFVEPGLGASACCTLLRILFSMWPNHHRFRAQLYKRRGKEWVGVGLIRCHVVLADSLHAS